MNQSTKKQRLVSLPKIMRVAMACLLPGFMATAPFISAAPPAGYTLVWSDEFDGTAIDTTKWLLNDSAIADYSPTLDAATVADGYLTQTIYTSGGTHYTTQLDTRFKYQPKYGYLEARIRTVNASGNWWAFWTFIDTITGTAPLRPHSDGVEMDIMEHRAISNTGADISNQIPSTLHWDGYGSEHKSQSSGLRGVNLATGFHTYAMEWTASYYKFYIDGSYLYTVTDSSLTDPTPPDAPVSQISQFLLLTGHIGGGWAGPILSSYGDLTTSTTKMDVDYVRVYQQSPPTPSAPVQVEIAPNSSGGWKLAWGLTDNAPSYNIKRSTAAGGPYSTIANTGRTATNSRGLVSSAGVSYVDTTAAAGTDYYYVVSAVNGTNESPNSLEARTNASGYPASSHTGLSAAQGVFSGVAAYKFIQQAVNVLPNTTYQAGVWIRGSGRTTLRVYNASNTQIAGPVIIDATPAWTYLTTSTFDTGSNTQLKVRIDDESPLVGATYVDDFFLGVPGGTNVLVNSGFESGSTGWDLSAAGTVWTVAASSGSANDNEHGGYQAAQGVFSGTTVYNYIRQTADVTADTDYIAGAWIRGGGKTTLRVYNLSGTQISTTTVINATAAWTYYTTTSFNTGSNTQVKLKIDDESGAATMYVDDIFLGVAGGANVLVNPDFERGTVGWDTAYAGNVWKIGQW